MTEVRREDELVDEVIWLTPVERAKEKLLAEQTASKKRSKRV